MRWQSCDPLVSQRGWMEGKREGRWIRNKEKTNKKGRERGNKRKTEKEKEEKTKARRRLKRWRKGKRQERKAVHQERVADRKGTGERRLTGLESHLGCNLSVISSSERASMVSPVGHTCSSVNGGHPTYLIRVIVGV